MGYLDSKFKEVAKEAGAPVVAAKGGATTTRNFFDLNNRAKAVDGIYGGNALGGLTNRLGANKMEDFAKEVAGRTVGVKSGLDAMPQLAEMRQLSQLGGKGVISAPQVSGSPWLQMAMKKQGADQARGLDVGVQNQAQALAAGRAMNPRAFMSGANENMAAGGLLDNMKMRQSMAQQNAMSNAGIQMQGAGKETDLNQFNAGLNNQAAQSNISNNVQDLINQNQNNAYKYGEVMKMKAANATSRGIANSGGGGKK